MKGRLQILLSLLLIGTGPWITTVAAADKTGTPMRPVTSAFTLESGATRLADTYLTPLKYSGWGVAFTYERWQAMRFAPQRWIMRMNARIEFDRTENPAGNATMLYGGIDFRWGMMRRWNVADRLTVGAGGETELQLGCLYNRRNGNNPASACAAITLGATAYATWSTTLWSIPLTVRFQPSIPVIGAFFSPDYGELYYEIYLGNHSGLVHCAWWGDYFAIDNLLTADLRFGATALRLGYRCYVLSTNVADITSRHIRHQAVVGVSGEWLSLSPGRRELSPEAEIISAYY